MKIIFATNNAHKPGGAGRPGRGIHALTPRDCGITEEIP